MWIVKWIKTNYKIQEKEKLFSLISEFDRKQLSEFDISLNSSTSNNGFWHCLAFDKFHPGLKKLILFFETMTVVDFQIRKIDHNINSTMTKLDIVIFIIIIIVINFV